MKKLQALLLSLVVLTLTPASFGSGGHGSEKASVTPSDALALLKEGNSRFVKGKPQHPHWDSETRATLAKGQSPHSIIVSCSDSRTGPEVVFDQGLGDLFVARAAGHVVASTDIASIEYAVEHLGSRLIVVMGHTSCGAVKAAMSTPKGKSAGSPHLDVLVAGIQRNLAADSSRQPASIEADPTVRGPVTTQAKAVAKELSARSAILRNRLNKGEIKIVPSVYDLETGRVEFLE